MKSAGRIFFLIALAWMLPAAAHAQTPTLTAIPDNLYAQDKATLAAERSALMEELAALTALIKPHDAKCSQVADNNTALVQECSSEMEQIAAKVAEYQQDLAGFNRLVNEKTAVKAENTRTIKDINALAKKLGWDTDKQDRLAKALNALDLDGDFSATDSQIIQTWNDILARRDHSEDFKQEASRAEGPVFPGAGTQSFQDCTIFALANAAGLPYGVAAARATKLISEGEWHSDAERADPQKVIEQHGLNGYEVIMLAEAFGRAEVVPMSDFSKTLKAGRPVLVDVVPQGGIDRGGHEVVLTKAFEHGGETWYELMDSNQDPQQRLYLSAKELSTILQEKGVAFQPAAGMTPKLLGAAIKK